MALHLRRTAIGLLLLTALLGLAYPLLETGLAAWWFPAQAAGSLTAQGSSLIGQPWSGPGFFHGRPDGDHPLASGGTNLGPRSARLARAVASAIGAERSLGVRHPTSDLVTSSGSGLDPDISPAAALAQVQGVARARRLAPARLRRLVWANVTPPTLGFLGQPVVDVLQLDRALARLAAHPRRSA